MSFLLVLMSRNYVYHKYSLPFLSWFHSHSLPLPHHYTAAAGIHPGRATLFTGQMPSVHNVTNTMGGIKTVVECDHTYLIPNECPTIGHYLQLENYDVSYKVFYGSIRSLCTRAFGISVNLRATRRVCCPCLMRTTPLL